MPSSRSNENQSSTGRTGPQGEPASGNRQQGSSNQARSQGNDSSAEILEYYRSNTDRLLEFLSRSDDESLNRLVTIVRSGASYDVVFTAIEQSSTNGSINQPNGTSH
ncbi:hypothetical protein N7539_004409 [Penicillium diatomitis]|uniref:Uncharacterized protein n=1 Tax=Penicillium diatomitis TaxID=2819901 RepID=A0A9W9XDR8_9EURO|nr:uncharacterized protein N7539_004409 [Penicillium diatomitis]KAJ5489519.1 hypothetical protein N7539_004409 [Penicillium diatomitis]